MTPEERARERALLIKLSEDMDRIRKEARETREASLAELQETLIRVRAANASPEIRMLDAMTFAENGRTPQAESALEGFIEHATTVFDQSEKDLDDVWLGIQESIVALDEGQTPVDWKPDNEARRPSSTNNQSPEAPDPLP